MLPAGSSAFAVRGQRPSNNDALAARYASIEPWKSRWSCERLVNPIAASCSASRRPIEIAIDDASSTHAVSPASSMRASSRCRSGASGVVSASRSRTPPTRASTVPSRPLGRPAASNIAATRNAVVVFPFVPVTPTTAMCSLGLPAITCASGPSASRTRRARTCGSPTSTSGRSTSSAEAPRAAAWGASSWPSWDDPGTQAKNVPGETVSRRRERSMTSIPSSRASGSRGAPLSAQSVASSTGRRVYREGQPPLVVALDVSSGATPSACIALAATWRKAGAATSPP